MSLSRAPRGLLLAAGVAVAALALTACGSDTGKSGGGGGTNFVTGAGGIDTVAKADRTAPRSLAGETLDGEELDVADLKGKVVVLNVWGSWCAPCRAEAPHFAKVSEELKPKGVEFVGINTRDPEKGKAIAFEEDYGITYPSLHDPIGRIVLNGFPKGTLMPQAIPSTVVLDRDGKIAARSLKALTEKELRDLVQPLMDEKPGDAKPGDVKPGDAKASGK